MKEVGVTGLFIHGKQGRNPSTCLSLETQYSHSTGLCVLGGWRGWMGQQSGSIWEWKRLTRDTAYTHTELSWQIRVLIYHYWPCNKYCVDEPRCTTWDERDRNTLRKTAQVLAVAPWPHKPAKEALAELAEAKHFTDLNRPILPYQQCVGSNTQVAPHRPIAKSPNICGRPWPRPNLPRRSICFTHCQKCFVIRLILMRPDSSR